ncbi:hypothetical protein EDD95_3082 [Streptomyces sp. CEV 2-1]|nr:hypothetical protein EDD95_3082 [Streptomyces sp. CEV 2-1]
MRLTPLPKSYHLLGFRDCLCLPARCESRPTLPAAPFGDRQPLPVSPSAPPSRPATSSRFPHARAAEEDGHEQLQIRDGPRIRKNTEIRKALCDAGAGVVVMAHWQAQSGKGAAVTHDAPRS